MKACLVAQTESDAELLQHLATALSERTGDVRVVCAQGDGISFSRSLLLTADYPIALVVSGRAIGEEAVRRRRQSIVEALGTRNIHVIVVNPELEVALFQSAAVPSLMFGLGEKVRTEYEPSKVLDRMVRFTSASRQDLYRSIDWKRVAQAPALAELCGFVRSSLQADLGVG